ncbi:MAG: hypothetical protein B6D47_07710 [Rhodocyclaceae bacterium UTPRO2]|nr:MAG: hypothetical protein B6D47_07710 [Rhodocyclaceae bacterium UTPRO2]
MALSQIRSGRHVWRCSSQADLDARMEKLDGLIESVGKKGYLQHDSLPELTGHDSPLGHAEVIVNIGRNGEPLFQDGRHRLAIARTLGIREIPVQIYIRHAEWQEFRDFLHRMAYGNMGAAKPGFLYQKPQHFDLADIPAEHDCQDRWEAIRSNLPQARGCALDIGANLGYFSHELDSAGFEATAVEYLPDVAYAAKRLALANGRSINVVQGDILAEDIFGKIGKSDFKVVLAINVFHHFIKTEEGFLRLRAFMKRLRADTLFFEPHHPADPQMQGVYLNPTPEKFAEMIVDWGGFNSSEPIFTAQDGRTIFKLTSAPG